MNEQRYLRELALLNVHRLTVLEGVVADHWRNRVS